MSATCDNIAFTYEFNDDEMVHEVKDPLEDLDSYEEITKYYRMNEKVFAEPIKISNEDTITDMEVTSDVCLINNVMKKKKTGKKTLCMTDVGENSLKPTCPQINCNKTFSTVTLLRAHIRRVHCADRNKYICEHCAAGFSASYLLQRHLTVHGDLRAECPVCGKMLSSRTSMSAHLRCHAAARPHACRLCRKTFVRHATLVTHLQFVHRDRDRGLHCHRCGEGFSSRKLLMNHKSCRQK